MDNKKVKSKTVLIIIAVAAFLFTISCSFESKQKSVNDSHLNHLYEEIVVDGQEMAIIHIYAEHPDYEWVDDDDEGTACVDDVARAAIFYMKDFRYKGNLQSKIKAEKLIKFIFFMQSDNGYFYNFIFPDHSINTSHQNSINRPGWWSWRAFWALTEAYPLLKNTDEHLSLEILGAMQKVVENLKDYIPVQKDRTVIAGVEVPKWLPYEYGSDQASLLIIGLTNYYKIIPDESVLEIINSLSEGIMLMQIKDSASKFYGAFLSWQNKWHGWGNMQSYALFKAYQVTNNKSYLNSALLEIDNFYNQLLNEGYINEFSIDIKNSKVNINEIRKYSQIAYSFRPMVYAALEAHKIAGEEKYSKYAADYSKWFFGNNHLNVQMYFPATGRCYDGLNETIVNKNSGAESTIEALLIFQELEKNKINLPNLDKDKQK
ncbi:MAG: hypothetical protein JEY94_02305 [Melioribacteraceae bacterium]|nr:hypothetical protein [Melioribacteraceae bacterium]